MYYKNVETDFPRYEFGSSSDMMSWMKSPVGIATSVAIVALLLFVVYWFFFRKKETLAPKYAYY